MKNKLAQQSLKILLCDFDDIRNPLLAAGQAQATFAFGQRLAQKGHRLIVLASRYPGSKDRIDHGIEYRHIGLGTPNVRINNFAYIFFLPFSLLWQKADIVVECFTAPMSTLCTPLITKRPVVVIPSCFDAERFAKLYHFPVQAIEKWGMQFYKYFLPFSSAVEAKIRMHRPNAICKIVPEGVDESFFQIKRKKAKHILFLGRMDMEQKGIDLLLKAYKLIEKKHVLPLVIAGNGPDAEKVQSLINELKLNDQVKMIGATYGAKKHQALSEAAFVVLPSRDETFSCFAVEALAAGLPTISFDIPGLSWTDANSCLKVKPFSIEGLAKQMISLSNPERNQRMGRAARQFATQFSWDHMADDYEQFFMDVYQRNI